MHPAMIWYWKRRARACGDTYAYADCGSYGMGSRVGGDEGGIRLSGRRGGDEDSVFGAGGLGVRRPLRFLASRLDLDDEQFAGAARILESLKIERAQATVDLRRSSADLAEALGAREFDRDKASSARERRVEAATHVQDAVSKALEELHGLLEPAQRELLATLIRSGSLRL